MNRKIIVILLVVLSLIVGCKNKKTPGNVEKNKAEKNKVEKSKPVAAKAKARTFIPSSYTGGKWKNGIDIEEKKQFFFTVAKNMPIPIRAGYRLKFAAAGVVTVENVFRSEKDEHSLIFVRTDKQLDPSKDGYPNPIIFSGCAIKPAPYSDAQKWKNGIQIKSKREFFFILGKGESIPMLNGDILRFYQAGQATVKRTYRMERKDGSFMVFVQVDRDLDPDADGYPHEVEMITGK